MHTLSFLTKILPNEGPYVLWTIRGDIKYNKVCDSLDQLSRLALALDAKGLPVYHACAAFKEKRKKEMRKAHNARAIKSQWLDVDVGDNPKKYSTQREAAAGVAQLCKKLSVPPPMIVSSGRGLHCYWPFTEEVPADQARVWMNDFAGALRSIGIKHDPTRTKDLASVLRPVGTHWRKNGVREVRLLKDCDPIDPQEFYKAFEGMGAPISSSQPADDGEWSTGGRSFPPSSIKSIIRQCKAVAKIAKLKGDVQEPIWRAGLGLCKFTEEGNPAKDPSMKLAHYMSMGHADYDPRETEEKILRWGGGPPSCEQFEELGQCDSCPHKGNIKSPIHLGYTLDTDNKQVSNKNSNTGTSQTSFSKYQPSQLPFWPKNYRVDGGFVQKGVKNDLGVVEYIPVFNRLVYPYMRYKDEDGVYWLRVCAEETGGKKWKEFDIPAKSLADNKAFGSALGAYEVYYMGNGVHARAFFQDVLSGMQANQIETEAYNSFGWHDDSFVIGTTAIKQSKQDAVFLGDRVPPDASTDYGTSGTIQEWSELINTIYNRPGAEAYQFLICAAFGAPLISLADSALWHGIPIALTGDSGLGKTTTCLAACSMYGDPSKFLISTNEMGATMNALVTRVALMRHLPLVLDELTGRTGEDLQAMLYALSNGKPKERNRGDGRLIGGNLQWDTFSFITGNTNITALLAQLDRTRAEATQLRCFEIALDQDYTTKAFEGINAKELIEKHLLANQYGAAGRYYLQSVIKSKSQVMKALHKKRSSILGEAGSDPRDDTRERFYLDTLATAMVGGLIAKKLGMIKFDLKKIEEWGKEHIKSLRSSRQASSSSPEDILGDFLTSLHSRTVVTDTMGDGRSKHVFEVNPSEIKEPVARIARSDKRMLVMCSYARKWCEKNKILYSWFKDELDKRGFLTQQTGSRGKGLRTSIFKGTSLPTTQVQVLEFDYDALLSHHHDTFKYKVIDGSK